MFAHIDRKTDTLLRKGVCVLFACSLVDLFEFTTDQPLSDFFGATADVVKFGISPEATARVLVNISVSAKDLDTLVGN